MKLTAVLVTVALLLYLSALPSAAAFKSSTSGNNIQLSNIGYAAHNYTDGNYTLDFSLVEQVVANATSSNYSAYLGFYSPVLYIPPSGPFDIIVDAPSSVSPGAAVASTVYLINKHPFIGGDYVVNYWIKDASGNILVGPGQVTVLAPAMITTEAIVSLNAPASAGSYFFWARVSWGTAYAEASDPFIVSQGGGAGAGGRGESTAATTRPPANQTNVTEPIEIGEKEGILYIVKQPMDIEISEGGIRERLFYFMNRGNENLSNVSLFISGLPLDSYTIEPPVYQNIEPNEVAVFKLTFLRLPDAGVHKIKLVMTSASGTDSMDGRVIVKGGAFPGVGAAGPQSLIEIAEYAAAAVLVLLALLILLKRKRLILLKRIRKGRKMIEKAGRKPAKAGAGKRRRGIRKKRKSRSKAHAKKTVSAGLQKGKSQSSRLLRLPKFGKPAVLQTRRSIKKRGFCGKCGTPFEAGQEYCEQCGRKL